MSKIETRMWWKNEGGKVVQREGKGGGAVWVFELEKTSLWESWESHFSTAELYETREAAVAAARKQMRLRIERNQRDTSYCTDRLRELDAVPA